MNTYTVYLGATPIAHVTTGGAYPCFKAAKTIAKFTGEEASLVWNGNGEEVAFFNPKNPEKSDEPNWG